MTHIGGETATRIMKEVMRGVFQSKDDTPDQAAYRIQIKKEIDEINERGDMIDMPKDWN